MGEALRRWVLRLLRVPAEPEAPSDGGGKVRVFRASSNFYRYNLLKWGLGQTGALVGLLVASGLLVAVVPDYIPDSTILSVIGMAEIAAWATFLLQLPVTYAMLRLDYDMRWYIVSDRSLRIREGLTRVREKTMTFANIQNMTVRQGPLQRLLGIADLEVRTAGGGGGSAGKGAAEHGGGGESMHVGYFRGVDNAAEVRDLIRDRVRLHRDAGLGDPDDDAATEPGVSAQESGPPALVGAARELLAEVRALRGAVAPRAE